MKSSNRRERRRYLPASGPLAISLLALVVTHHLHTFRQGHPWLSWAWFAVLTLGLVVVSTQFVLDMRAVRAAERRGESVRG